MIVLCGKCKRETETPTGVDVTCECGEVLVTVDRTPWQLITREQGLSLRESMKKQQEQLDEAKAKLLAGRSGSDDK